MPDGIRISYEWVPAVYAISTGLPLQSPFFCPDSMTGLLVGRDGGLQYCITDRHQIRRRLRAFVIVFGVTCQGILAVGTERLDQWPMGIRISCQLVPAVYAISTGLPVQSPFFFPRFDYRGIGCDGGLLNNRSPPASPPSESFRDRILA
jgi:hypothetical protein